MSGLDDLRRMAGISDEEWKGYKEGDRFARKSVRDWHPKCATCEDWTGGSNNHGLCNHRTDEGATAWAATTGRHHYCSMHTALTPKE